MGFVCLETVPMAIGLAVALLFQWLSSHCSVNKPFPSFYHKTFFVLWPDFINRLKINLRYFIQHKDRVIPCSRPVIRQARSTSSLWQCEFPGAPSRSSLLSDINTVLALLPLILCLPFLMSPFPAVSLWMSHRALNLTFSWYKQSTASLSLTQTSVLNSNSIIHFHIT